MSNTGSFESQKLCKALIINLFSPLVLQLSKNLSAKSITTGLIKFKKPVKTKQKKINKSLYLYDALDNFLSCTPYFSYPLQIFLSEMEGR